METAQTDVQRVARTLADPTRFRIYGHISTRSEPIGVAELTELLGLNHNAIRQHLAQLVDGALVIEEREVRDRPGRPRVLYRIREDGLAPIGDSSRSYRRLSQLLLDVTMSGDTPYTVGLRAAEENLADPGDIDRVRFLIGQLSVEGFEPDQQAARIVLGSCPFADVAAEGPSVVCEIHRGLIDGYLGQEAPLLIRNPRRAGCEVQLPE